MKTIKISFLILLVAMISGCAFGRHVDYSVQAANPGIYFSSENEVAVTVQDLRPYVISGKKSPNFVGVRRAGFYNPFDVRTVSGKPLASDLQQSVLAALEKAKIRSVAQPYSSPPRAADDQQRLLVLRIDEWKTDTYKRVRFDYDVTATVFDRLGNTLATHSAKNSSAIANFYVAAKDALTEAIGDPGVVAALQRVGSTQTILPDTSPRELGHKNSYDECMERVLRIQDKGLRVRALSSCDAAI
jgi:hypothetical protein